MSLINLLIVVSIFQCVHCLKCVHELTELKSEIGKEVLEDLENWKKLMKAELKQEIKNELNGFTDQLNDVANNMENKASKAQLQDVKEDLGQILINHLVDHLASVKHLCVQNPCLNQSTCIDLENGFQCLCGPGMTGRLCDTEIPPCPIDDSNFKLIDNQCFYFSKVEMNQTTAQENCKEKMGPYGGGRLFEPKSLTKNFKVAEIANDFWGPTLTWAFIGVTDKLQEGTYAYISDGSTIKFTPPWAQGYHGYGTSHNCAVLVTPTTSYSAHGQWIDWECNNHKYSICESTLAPN